MNKIEEALSKLFTKHRVVFWNDEKQELIEQFNELWKDTISYDVGCRDLLRKIINDIKVE